MNLFVILLVLMAALAVVVVAEPKPETVRASRYRVMSRHKDDIVDADKRAVRLTSSIDNDNVSSGRLFLRKSFFRNLFKRKQNQPIIIVIGSKTDTIKETPIDTATDTPTDTDVDTLTNTDTNDTTEAPATAADTSTPATDPMRRIQFYSRDRDNVRAEDDITAVDEESLAAALSAGSDQYVDIDQEIKGNSYANAYRAPTDTNLRLRDARRGQVIGVRVPAKYQSYFNDGQTFTVRGNKKSRPAKRRMIRRRRTNSKRIHRNRNKQRRIVAV